MFNYISRDPIPCLSVEVQKNTVPISLVSTDDLEEWLADLSNADKLWINRNKFKAAKGTVLIFSNGSGEIDKVIAGTGAGDMSPWDYADIATSLPDGSYKFETQLDDLQSSHATFGWAMAHYKFDLYLKEKMDKTAVLNVPDNCDVDEVSRLVRGTTLARDLVNTPTCDMGPPELADVSEKLANEFGASINITVGDNLLKEGFNAIHTVGRAAEKEPRLIDLTWGDKNAPKVTLVGKGVCFDTGGLDIKPSNAMLTMKKDMGGAAHVLALGQMILESGINIRLRILIPAVENNIAGNAFRPGDIIKSYKGTTIEVGNTDAEGRLVLCDALALASEEKPDILLDFATLTGAARVALGPDIPPYFTDDDALSDELLAISKEEFDPLWPLPLYAPYKKMLSSSIADTNNIASTGFGGAITAALFLKEFVDDDISWTHFDVYAWNASECPGRPKGGEAMGIRSVYRFLVNKFNG